MSNKANPGFLRLRNAGLVAAMSLALAGVSTIGASAAPARDRIVSSDEFPADTFGVGPFQTGSSCAGRFGAAQMGGFASPGESPYTRDGRCRF